MKIEDYPKTVVEGTGITALEYFNGHMEDKANDVGFFKNLRKRCDDLGATNTMMLCRSDNALDSPEKKIRKKAVEGYRPFEVPGSKLAFKLRGQQIRYLAIHPRRKAPVASVELVKGPDKTAPVVMAMTAEAED